MFCAPESEDWLPGLLVMLNSERRKASIDMIYTLTTTPGCLHSWGIS